MDSTETVELGIDQNEMFKSALADDPKPAAQAPPAEAKPEPAAEQPRDEQGRFAAKTEPEVPAAPAQQPTAQPEPTKDDQAAIPSWRLREVSEARQAAERRNEELTRQSAILQSQMEEMRRQIASINAPKQEPVNWFENPDGAFKQQFAPLEQQFHSLQQTVLLNTSRAMAIAAHGLPAVNEMEKAVEAAQQRNDPELQMLAAQMQRSTDPVGVAMSWHRRMKAIEIIGDDPAAYEQKTKEKLLKDPEFRKMMIEAIRAEAGQNPNARPVVQLPPNLSSAGTGASQPSGDDADMSNAGLFKHAMGGMTRR